MTWRVVNRRLRGTAGPQPCARCHRWSGHLLPTMPDPSVLRVRAGASSTRTSTMQRDVQEARMAASACRRPGLPSSASSHEAFAPSPLGTSPRTRLRSPVGLPRRRPDRHGVLALGTPRLLPLERRCPAPPRLRPRPLQPAQPVTWPWRQSRGGRPLGRSLSPVRILPTGSGRVHRARGAT